jgi:teichuronic acid biosynthesis glycosyltransferase TuaG
MTLLNENELVSVIITNYNGEKYVKKAITSVKNQTYNNIELIIVDDASTDGSQAIIKELCSSNDLIIFNKNNTGLPAKSRNFGLKKVSGKYVCFLDSDDYWKPDKITKQLTIIKKYNLHGIGCRSTIIGRISILSKIYKIFYNKFNAKKTVNNILISNGVPLSSLMLSRTSLLFDESPLYYSVEDLDYQLSYLIKYNTQIHLLEEPLIFYRVHEKNISNNMVNIFNKFNVIVKHKKSITNKDFKLAINKHFNYYYKCIIKNIITNQKIMTIHLNSNVCAYLSFKNKLVNIFVNMLIKHSGSTNL